MNRAQFSTFIWSLHLFTAGMLLLVAPTAFFTWVGLHDPGSGMWHRLSGMLMGTMGYFFFEAARANNREFMRWGSRARMAPFFFLTLFVAMKLESPLILAFGVIDILTGMWTLNALRLDAEEQPAAV